MTWNKTAFIWLLLFLAMSAILIIDFRKEQMMSDWLFFVWLFNLNFLTYAIYNKGSIVTKFNNEVHTGVLLKVHNMISSLKLLFIVAFVVMELTVATIPYFNTMVIAVLAVDIVILLYRSRMNLL